MDIAWSTRGHGRPNYVRMLFASLAALLGLGTLAVIVSPAAQAADPCGPSGSTIACENSKPGTPDSEWDINGSGSSAIEGFATDMSVNAGSTVDFKIHSAASYSMTIYRLGYYNGLGARRIATVSPDAAVSQANKTSQCVNNSASTGLIDCGTWGVSASWAVPSTAVSGVYFALIEQANGAANHVVFVVRNDASHSDLVFQTSDTTWQAYNSWGGNSLYAGSPIGRAYKVSYNRPFNTRGSTPWGRDFLFANEYPMIRFLEAQGYDVSYTTGVDTARRGNLITNHKTFVTTGHDEYWSGQQRANVEAARDAGVNLALFSGNDVYWKTRWEKSVGGTATDDYRTLVTYKETWQGARTDPEDVANGTWTGTWRDPRFTPQADGGRPENALTGTIFTVNRGTNPIKVPEADGKLRLWRNTPAATLGAGQTYTTPANVLGYEWNEDLDNGHRPAGAIKLSHATYTVPEKLVDYGTKVVEDTATHNLTLYRAASGALVFSAGTVQWSWGLDTDHDGNDGVTNQTDPAMRQATVNLLADMGAQPYQPQLDLSVAAASTDTTAPTATITSPAAGASLASGTAVTVTGTATDVGGRVAGVEVSLDGGRSWHPASGRSSWTYTGTVKGAVGSTTVQARASDDSANLGAATQRATTVSCPCALFQDETPTTVSEDNRRGLEAGVRFSPDVDGWVTGITFLKSAGNTGTHTGTLWSPDGTSLATGTFVDESATGWQRLVFDEPVRVTKDTAYVASYYSPTGIYSNTAQYFMGQDGSAYPLTAARTTEAAPNGVFHDGSSAFPASTYQGGNYFVSPVFELTAPPDTKAPAVGSVSPADDTSSVARTVKPTVTFTEPIKPGTTTITLSSAGGQVAGSTSFDTGRKVATFTPAADLAPLTTYTLAVTGATDDADNPMRTAAPTTFRTAQVSTAGVCPCTIWDDSTVPTTVDSGDSDQVELGVKFRSTRGGKVTGVRFYKGPRNIGTHTGSLWSAGGTELATGTFSGESATGWQTLTFASPVTIEADTTYVASYHSPGYYSVTSSGLSNAVTRGPLTALASGASGGNGVYAYGAKAFPTGSYNAGDYGVDVVFSDLADSTAPAVAATSPAAGTSGARVGAPITVTFSEPVTSGTTATLKSGGSTLGSSLTWSTDRLTATVVPDAALSPATAYQVTVAGATDASGNTMATPYAFDFTTSGANACPCSIYPSDYVPTQKSTADFSAYELGVRFTPSVNGSITALRFYKGEGNTGTHTGRLWTTGGQLLSSAQFTDESGSGWQQVSFPQPVAVSAGTTYVASYSDPAGHYAADPHQFDTDWVNSPLTAPANAPGAGNGNGVFATSPGDFPQSSYNATGYGVDVVFESATAGDRTPPQVSSTSPVNGATSVPTGRAPVARFNEPIDEASVEASITGPDASVPVTTTVGAGQTVTITPTSGLAPDTAYTVSVKASDLAGNAMTAPKTWTFRTARTTTTPPYSIWRDDEGPAVESDDDRRAVELGVHFNAASDGYVSGVRFWKGPGNTGTHTGTLWTAGGTELATATFAGESASGWQEVTFNRPVAVTAGTEYVASYHAPNGQYSYTAGGLGASVTRGPLTATGGGFAYGDRAFPGNGSATNYWVDVVFDSRALDTQAPVVSDIAATASGTSARVSWTTDEASTSKVSFGTAEDALTSTATGPSGVTAHSVDLTGLTPGQQYFYRVTSADADGNSTTVPTGAARFVTPGGAAGDLALGKAVKATSTQAAPWSLAAVTDGIFTSTAASPGWSSIKKPTVNHTESVQVDLGSARSFRQVSLFPRTDAGNVGQGFPVDFALETSNDAKVWTAVQTVSDAPLPTTGQHYVLPSTVTARYVRVTGTRLRPNPNDGNQFKMQLAEIGVYAVGSSAGVTPPVISAVTGTSTGATTGTVTWTTDKAASSVVAWGTSPTDLSTTVTGAPGVTAHSVALSGLPASTRIYYRVTSTDTNGSSATAPAPTSAPASFAPSGSATQTTLADFAAGTAAKTVVTDTNGGEVTLAPALADEFTGTALGATWKSTSLGAGSTVTVANGQAAINGRVVRAKTAYSAGRSLLFTGTFRPVPNQWAGVASTDFTGTTDWAAFRTDPTGQLVAETRYGGATAGAGVVSTPVPGSPTGSAHRFTVAWTAGTATYSVDGAVVATHTLPDGQTLAASLYPAFRDGTVDSSALAVDSVELTPFQATGTFTSSVIDAGQSVAWGVFTPTATTPPGTTIKYQVRTGPTPTAGSTGWSAFATVAPGGDIPGSGHYLQYKATLTTSGALTSTPELTSVSVAYEPS